MVQEDKRFVYTMPSSKSDGNCMVPGREVASYTMFSGIASLFARRYPYFCYKISNLFFYFNHFCQRDLQYFFAPYNENCGDLKNYDLYSL